MAMYLQLAAWQPDVQHTLRIVLLRVAQIVVHTQTRSIVSLLLQQIEECIVDNDLFAEERRVHTVEEVKELCTNSFHTSALARHFAIDVCLLVVGNQRLSLLVVGDDAVRDGLFAGIISTSLNGGAMLGGRNE